MANNQNFKIKNGLDVGTDIYVNSNLHVGGTVVFEGATANDFETTLSATDPTQDNTIVVPNAGGTLAVSVSDTTTTTQGDLNLDFSLSATGAVSATGDAHGLATTDSPTFAGLTINGNTIVLEGSTANDFETQLNVVDPTADNLINIPDNSGTFVVNSSNTTTTTQGDLNTTVSISATGVVTVSGDAHGLATTDTPTFAGVFSNQIVSTSGSDLFLAGYTDAFGDNIAGGRVYINGGGASGTENAGGVYINGGDLVSTSSGLDFAGEISLRGGDSGANGGNAGAVYLIGGTNVATGATGAQIYAWQGSNLGDAGAVRLTSGNAAGTDKNGGIMYINAGRGTGAGVGSRIIFQTSASGASGTATQTLLTIGSIDENGLTIDATRYTTGVGGRYGTLIADSGLTASRTYTLPDASGTIALTSDIPAESDTLATVTGRGATTTDEISVGGLIVDASSGYSIKGAAAGSSGGLLNLEGVGGGLAGNPGVVSINGAAFGDADGVVYINGQNGSTGTGTVYISYGGNNGQSYGDVYIGDNSTYTNKIYINNLQYPTADGSSGQALVTDGAGTLSFSSITETDTLASVTGRGSSTTVGISVEGLTIGRGAGGINTNSSFGWSALSSNTTGANNSAFGRDTLSTVTTGEFNTAIGSGALKTTNNSYNTAVGYNALTLSTSAFNTAVGANALDANTSGSFNTAVGSGAAGAVTSGTQNVAVGVGTLQSTTTSSYNTAVGNSALTSNQTGAYNTAVGWEASNNNLTSYNTSLGYRAGRSTTSGGSNVVIGATALYNNTTGANNVVIGRDAASYIADGATSNTSPDQSIFIGAVTRAKTATDTNEIVIGYGAIGNGSNTTTIGNASTTNTYILGNINARYKSSAEAMFEAGSTSGTVDHDYSFGNVYYRGTVTSDYTVNFTNVPTSNGTTYSMVEIVPQGATAYLPTAVQIAGSAQTILWQGGSTPSGTANGVDVVSFTLIRTGSAWTVLGSVTPYS